MGKIDRLVSIVMILLQKDVVSATQLSQMLEVSKRTVLRDMEALSLSKVPIYAINGANGGYGIMEEYKIDKRLLTSIDLENILTALNGLEQILVSQEVKATINKIEGMVNSSIKNTIHLSFYDWSGRPEILNLCRSCQEAILQNRLVTFSYTDRNGIMTHRIVEPYQLHFSEMSWYLKAFCLERKEYRTFKLSRTENLHIKKETFVPRDYEGLKKSEEYYMELVEVKALILPSIKDHFIERYGSKSVEPYNLEYLLATIYLPQNDIGYEFLAGFGSKIKIIEPKSYVEKYREFINQLIKQYDEV